MKSGLKLLSTMLILLATTIFISGCGDNKETLKVYNWGDYIDREVLKDFEKETGIKVIYDEFDTNEDMYIKVKNKRK